MAIVVPFLASAMGATATTAALVSVAFQVTGLNDKINKAAAKVFGEDLVKAVNIIGAGYAMFNGGFDLGGSDAAASGMEAASATALEASGGLALQEANAAAGLAEMAAAAPETVNLASMAETADLAAGPSLSRAQLDGTDAMGANAVDGSFNLLGQAKSVTPEPALVPKTEAASVVSEAQPAAQVLSDRAVAQQQPAAALSPAQAPASQAASTLPTSTKPVTSVFDRVTGVLGKQGAGFLLQGVGQAVQATQAQRQRAQELEYQKQQDQARRATSGYVWGAR